MQLVNRQDTDITEHDIAKERQLSFYIGRALENTAAQEFVLCTQLDIVEQVRAISSTTELFEPQVDERIDLLMKGAKAKEGLKHKLDKLESKTRTAVESVFFGVEN